MRDPLALTSGQLNGLVWGWKPAITHRELQDRYQIHSEQMWSARIGAVARYLNVRDKALMATEGWVGLEAGEAEGDDLT